MIAGVFPSPPRSLSSFFDACVCTGDRGRVWRGRSGRESRGRIGKKGQLAACHARAQLWGGGGTLRARGKRTQTIEGNAAFLPSDNV